MLAFNFFGHHVEGGSIFMFPLTILFVISLALFAYLLAKASQSITLIKVFRHLGLLIMAYGVFGTLVGLLQMFGALETLNENLSLQVISGGVKVALLNVAYGAAYFFIVQLLYIILCLRSRATA
jgi:hypothetical protein